MVISEGQPRQGGRASRKDRSRSRDTSQRKTLATDVEISDDEQEDLKRYTGPLAAADMIRMRKELETSRKQLHISEKKIIKQNKEIEKLKRELATAQQSNTQHCQTIEKYKTQTKKSDEVINAIEGHINCSVCMDLMHKPHGLSPCGHVLCQECLQSWFRAAVPDEDEMYDDEAGDFLLYKKKTCPVCRSTVRSRPIQLFVIKSIASTLRKVKTVPGSPQRASPVPDEEDPWKGIFFEEHGEGSHLEDDDEDDDDDEGEYEDGWSSEEGYGTPTDEEPYDGVYIIPRWSPPTVNITPFEFPFLDHISDEDLSMLRRGVTLQMIDIFNMRYNHDTGLQATIDGVNTVFLGFNIHLLEGDESGEEYMDWVLNDIHERPDRWEKVDSINGSWRAWMLVPEVEEDDYSTTDSEVWAANMAAEAEDDDELDFL
ncbi:hypothetical protein C8Q75DRAFT_719030 [Abortiporus biennis]|nr:hypothetical protein C8Q75DRAFT_719030 [Abortiporus biennis]